MRRSWPLVLAALVLTGVGVFLSANLLNKHLFKSAGLDWIDAVCESGGNSSVSCDAVLNSRWGVFPPRGIDEDVPDSKESEGEPAGEAPRAEKEAKQREPFRVPVAYLGLAYFTFLFVWFAGVGRPGYARRGWHLLPLGLNICGVLASVAFLLIMFLALEVWCPLCLATQVTNFLLLVVNFLLWPRHPGEALDGDTVPAAEFSRFIHPTWRLVTVVIVLGLALANLEYQLVLKEEFSRVAKRMTEAMKEVQASTQTLTAMYWNAKKQEIEIRPDDPIRHNGPKLPTLVVWSDFECPHCRLFAARFEQKFFAHFDGYLQVIFKHYPGCSDCNPYVSTKPHPNACKGARIAEAARLQGGSERFWEVHDLLFQFQKELAKVDAKVLAERIGLDGDRMLRDMDSDTVSRRITEDIEQAHRLGIESTPAVFLSGRRVSPLALNVDRFWRTMGSFYQNVRTKRQHEAEQKAQEEPSSATPDSLDPPDAR